MLRHTVGSELLKCLSNFSKTNLKMNVLYQDFPFHRDRENQLVSVRVLAYK